MVSCTIQYGYSNFLFRFPIWTASKYAFVKDAHIAEPFCCMDIIYSKMDALFTSKWLHQVEPYGLNSYMGKPHIEELFYMGG